MRKAISSAGRFQFSLEKQYSVSCSIPNRAHSSVMRRTTPAPRRWPSIRGSPWRWAQRPLPSMMMAMWRGIFSADTSASASGLTAVDASGVSVGASGPISAPDRVSASDIVGIVGKDRLLPVRPHGNDFHGPAYQRAEPIEIVAGLPRQIGDAADVTDFFPP